MRQFLNNWLESGLILVSFIYLYAEIGNIRQSGPRSYMSHQHHEWKPPMLHPGQLKLYLICRLIPTICQLCAHLLLRSSSAEHELLSPDHIQGGLIEHYILPPPGR